MSEHILSFEGVGTFEAGAAAGTAVRAQANNAAVHKRIGAKQRRKQSIQYRLLYGVTFAAFLAGGILELLNPFRARSQQGVIERARRGAGTCVAYAFMG